MNEFAAWISVGVLAGLVILVLAAQRRGEAHPIHWLDAGLGGVAGGVTGARLFHVALNWAYFADHTSEIASLSAGGFDWHGALYGGLLGVWLVARWRQIPLRPLGDALALAWPLGMMTGWIACAGGACGFGAEVWTLADFPAWAVSEQPDTFGTLVPRYNTQWFGAALGLILLVVVLQMAWRGWLAGRRLWLVLLFSGVGMFLLDYWRGDRVLSPLAAVSINQLLDASVFVLATTAFFASYLDGWRQRRT